MADDTCRRCGDSLSDHLSPGTGQMLIGWRESRFTGGGFCRAQHKSGGIVGSLQRCGCLGYVSKLHDGQPFPIDLAIDEMPCNCPDCVSASDAALVQLRRDLA